MASEPQVRYIKLQYCHYIIILSLVQLKTVVKYQLNINSIEIQNYSMSNSNLCIIKLKPF